MVHNMAPFIGACIKSLQWVDSIFIFDDHSTDGGVEVAREYSTVPIFSEKSQASSPAFLGGELRTRNYVLVQAFKELKTDLMVVIDADEMLSSNIRPKIIETFSDPAIDSMMFSIWHLYDSHQYLHFWETTVNGVRMIDPHTRVIKRGKHFTPLFEDGSHPTLEPTIATKCLNGPHHFHLKYHYKSTLPNYSLYFLPERPTESDIRPYLRELPFELPKDVDAALSIIDWGKMPFYNETPHYAIRRVNFSDHKEALIHPKDKENL